MAGQRLPGQLTVLRARGSRHLRPCYWDIANTGTAQSRCITERRREVQNGLERYEIDVWMA